MTLDPWALLVIVVMAAAAALCRLLGFSFMRFIPVTPRVEAGLNAIPLAVMIGIIVPPVIRGGFPELAGLLVTILTVRLRGNDLVAILAGMGTVGLLRAVA